MFLVELVMQGVRGVRELARLRFQRGFNFVAAGNEAGKTTAVDSMQRLLFPSSQAGLMEALVSRHTPDASRSAIVMFSDDGSYYRIIQDFSKKAVNLSKYNADTKDFTLMHKDWDSAVQFMSGLTAGMAEEDFARVFLFRRDHYAGQAASSAPAPAAAQAKPARPAPPPPGAAPKANQARIAELRDTLKKAEEAADAEYRAQSAKLALDEVRKKLTTIEESEQKKAELEAQVDALKACETLPENLSELIEAHERSQGQKASDVDELQKELAGRKMQLAEVPDVNLMTDKLFLGGVVLGVVAFILGIFVLTSEQAMYFPFGLIAAAALMAVGWYNGSRKNSQRRAIANDIEVLQHDLADIERRHEQEGAAIKSCMQATGSKTAAELKEKADNYRYFLSLQEDMEEQLRRTIGDLSVESLHADYNRLQQEALDLEKAARAIAQNNIDTYSIRQDIERLEGETMPAASWDFGAESHDLPADFGAPAPGRQAGFHEVLQIASRISGIEMETLVPAVEAAAQRNLSAISGGRYVRIEAGHDGGHPVVHAKDDSVVNYAELSHGTRDLIYFCLRTGLVEAIAGKRRLPFILDDPLAGFDPARQKAASQILRSLGTKTQVVLFSSNSALKAEGDAFAELK